MGSAEDHGLQDEFQALRESQENIPLYSRYDRPRLPTVEELARLPSGVMAKIIPPREREMVEGLIIVLHDHGGNESPLMEFAQEHLRPKHTACLLLRGVVAIEGRENSYQWESNSDTFLRTSRLLLEELIRRYLIQECKFPPGKIIIFGQGEGGEAGLLTFLRWESIEFGGVICVGGRLIAHVTLPEDTKSNTPVLLLGGALGITTPTAKNQIEEYFSYVDDDLLPAREDDLPMGKQLKTLRAFFAHRLQEEEWTQPAIITFGM
jgi:predicted esterase